MTLTATQKVWARRQVVADIFGAAPVTSTKAEIDTAMAALTTWLEDPTVISSFNAALTGTALASASAAVKAEALAIAARARYGGEV